MASRLTVELGRKLRSQREKLGWSQARLAEEAGTSQQCLSRIERGGQAPGTETLERLFGALGWQLRFELEALDSDLDDRIDRHDQVGDDERVAAVRQFWWYMAKMAGLPYVIEGELGGVLHGVPLDTTTLSIAVAERDLDDLARWILSLPNCLRWNPQWDDFGGPHPDPRRPGPLHWHVGLSEIRVSLVPELPEAVWIRAGEEEFPVRPLDQIAEMEPTVARVMRRVSARRETARRPFALPPPA